MKTVIEMALEAGCRPFEFGCTVAHTTDLERLVELARADEREAFIEKVDWTALMRQGGLVTWGDAEELGDRVVAAIRARNEQ